MTTLKYINGQEYIRSHLYDRRQKQDDDAGETMLCYYAELLYGNSMLAQSERLFATMHEQETNGLLSNNFTAYGWRLNNKATVIQSWSVSRSQCSVPITINPEN